MQKIKRVAVYIRTSTEEETVNWMSLDIQKDSILKYLEQRTDDFSFDKEEHIYIDWGCSWQSEDRPALTKMMNDVKDGKFDIILVWKIDRLFRKKLYLLQYLEELSKYWVGVKSVTQDFDTSNSYGKIVLKMLIAISEAEKEVVV